MSQFTDAYGQCKMMRRRGTAYLLTIRDSVLALFVIRRVPRDGHECQLWPAALSVTGYNRQLSCESQQDGKWVMAMYSSL